MWWVIRHAPSDWRRRKVRNVAAGGLGRSAENGAGCAAHAVHGADDTASLRSSVVDGALAGVGFAVLFVGLQRAGRGAGLWPSAASQVVSALPMLGLYGWRALRGRTGALAARPAAPFVRFGPLLGGVFAAAAVTFYFLATRRGLLTVVAVLTSLYPAVTVALARGLLSERIGRRQGAGLALAGLSVALISAA
jgi:drug/metabolite transporter (DMT)-like permease